MLKERDSCYSWWHQDSGFQPNLYSYVDIFIGYSTSVVLVMSSATNVLLLTSPSAQRLYQLMWFKKPPLLCKPPNILTTNSSLEIARRHLNCCNDSYNIAGRLDTTTA